MIHPDDAYHINLCCRQGSKEALLVKAHRSLQRCYRTQRTSYTNIDEHHSMPETAAKVLGCRTQGVVTSRHTVLA
jgi:hypothetical protein